MTLYGRYSATDDTSKLSFKTNRDEKYCLSSEIQCLNVEEHLILLDFTRISMGIPVVIYIGIQ